MCVSGLQKQVKKRIKTHEQLQSAMTDTFQLAQALAMDLVTDAGSEDQVDQGTLNSLLQTTASLIQTNARMLDLQTATKQLQQHVSQLQLPVAVDIDLVEELQQFIAVENTKRTGNPADELLFPAKSQPMQLLLGEIKEVYAEYEEEPEAVDDGVMDLEDDAALGGGFKVNEQCPVTMKHYTDMDEPVQSRTCGHAYEKAAILELFNAAKASHQSCKCPMAGCGKQIVALDPCVVLMDKAKNARRRGKKRKKAGRNDSDEDVDVDMTQM
jgi:hypothetical protein